MATPKRLLLRRCQRKSEACRNKKFLRQDLSEEFIVKQLQKLVCPSQEIIDWVASAMHEHNKDNVENYERLSASILVQLDRVKRMDNNLYDDKLSGDISQERYTEKHEQLTKETTELNEKLDQVDGSLGLRLEHKLVLLELSQKAAQIYQSKSPDNKRLIISKLFEHLTVKEGVLSVKYTKFAQVIAENVEETYKIMEDQK